jgi:transcriptional regulator with XRE-family HTH domain
MKTAEYITAVQAKTTTGSLYAAAKLLNLSEQAVANYASGKRLPDAFGCLRIAQALDLPLEQVLADVESEREKDETKRKQWIHISRKFAASVLIAGYTAIGTIAALWHSPAEAALLTPARMAINDLPIMRQLSRTLATLWRIFVEIHRSVILQ